MSPAPVTVAALDLSEGSSVNPTNFVVDAGVAVKWYVPEVHEADAKRFLSPVFTLHVPELFFPEFGNIIWKKARLLKTPEISEAEGALSWNYSRGLLLRFTRWLSC